MEQTLYTSFKRGGRRGLAQRLRALEDSDDSLTAVQFQDGGLGRLYFGKLVSLDRKQAKKIGSAQEGHYLTTRSGRNIQLLTRDILDVDLTNRKITYGGRPYGI